MPQKVLVIDDSKDIHRLLGVGLKREDVAMYYALAPQDGIDLAIAECPDIILLDVDMPTASGFEVCRKLKADPRTRTIPIMFLTGANAIYSKIEGFDLGAIDYITKPFDLDELRARVRSALRNKRERDALTADANVDPLSGIGNRRAFEHHLGLRIGALHATGEQFALVLVDLDHFKSINDGYGHPFGDRVIQTAAALLAASVRDGDVACRIGGEEFAVLLAGTMLDGANRFAERLRARIAAVELSHEGKPVKITASFGVTSTSCFDAKKCTGETMIAAADQALYEAKQAGRDCVRLAA